LIDNCITLRLLRHIPYSSADLSKNLEIKMHNDLSTFRHS